MAELWDEVEGECRCRVRRAHISAELAELGAAALGLATALMEDFTPAVELGASSPSKARVKLANEDGEVWVTAPADVMRSINADIAKPELPQDPHWLRECKRRAMKKRGGEQEVMVSAPAPLFSSPCARRVLSFAFLPSPSHFSLPHPLFFPFFSSLRLPP